jgi:hypothetical protein
VFGVTAKLIKCLRLKIGEDRMLAKEQ